MPARSSRLWTSAKPRCGQQLPHRGRLVVAVLEQQPAARGQVRRRAGDDAADVVQAVGPGDQGAAAARGAGRPGAGRRPRCRAGSRRSGRSAGWSAPSSQSASAKRTAQAQPAALARATARASGAGVDRRHPGVGPRMLDAPGRSRRCRCRGRARRGRRPAVAGISQRPVDQGLGVRPRHQHAGVDLAGPGRGTPSRRRR